MTTRADLRTELKNRLRDTSNAIWTDDELDGFLAFGIKSLYPSWYLMMTETTTAGDGPLQTAPSGARNIHFLGYKRLTSARVRPLRNWKEGDGEAFVPKTGITGDTLVWGWTKGFTAPTDDVTALDVPPEAEEPVIIRAQIAALEAVLSDRVAANKYLALSVREGVTEEDVATTLDALHASLRERLEHAMTLPEVKQ